jgi:hypothetical protein
MAQEPHRRRSAAAAAGAPPPPDPSTPCAIVECLGSCPPLSPPDLGVVRHGEDGCGVEEVPFCSYLRRLTRSHAAPPLDKDELALLRLCVPVEVRPISLSLPLCYQVTVCTHLKFNSPRT